MKATAGCAMSPTIMLTGFPEGNYKHDDVAKLVWSHFPKQTLHSLYYNLTVLTLQRRAFVFFPNWTTCCNFVREHIKNPVSVKGHLLTVHYVVKHMSAEPSEEMMYVTMMKLSNAGVTEPESLEERLLCVEISETSLDIIKAVVEAVASVVTFVSFLPLANRICFEMADASSVAKVVEKYTEGKTWKKVLHVESVKSLKQRLQDSGDVTVHLEPDTVQPEPSDMKCEAQTPVGSTEPITARPNDAVTSEKPGPEINADSTVGGDVDNSEKVEQRSPRAEASSLNVKPESLDVKCEAQPPLSEPSDTGSQPALQTSGAVGGTNSEPITAPPSDAVATETPGPEIAMDSTVDSETTEVVEKPEVKGEEASPTTLAVSSGNTVSAASSPATSATALISDKNQAELHQTAADPKHKPTKSRPQCKDKEVVNPPLNTCPFDEPDFNMADFVTVDEVGEYMGDKSPEPHRSSSSKHSSRSRSARQSSGVSTSDRRTSTRSRDSKKSDSSSSSSSNSNKVSSSSKSSETTKSHSKPSASVTKSSSSSSSRSTFEKTQQSKTKSPAEASNAASSGYSTRSSSSVREKERAKLMLDGTEDSSSNVQLTGPEGGQTLNEENSQVDEGKVCLDEDEMEIEGYFQVLDSVTQDDPATCDDDSHPVQDAGSAVKQLSEEDVIPSGDSDLKSNKDSVPEYQDQRANIVHDSQVLDSERKEVPEEKMCKDEEIKGKVPPAESCSASKEVENPDSQFPNQDLPTQDPKDMIKDHKNDLPEQENFQILDSTNNQTATEDESQNLESLGVHISKEYIGLVVEGGDTHQVIDPTTTTSKSEEKEKSPGKQERTSETGTMRDTTAEVSEKDKRNTEEILDSVEEEPVKTERAGRRRSARGKKEDKVELTEVSEKPEILDSVEDSESTITTRSTRGKRERTAKTQNDTPTRRRRIPARELQKQNQEKTPKKEEESPPDESTPSTSDKDGSKEDAMRQVFSSPEEVLKVDRPAPGRKRKRGRPKKVVKSTKKGSAALKDDKDASEEEQIVDPVDETVDDQLPAGHIPKNNDEQTEERASLPGSPKNEEEEEPMREISDSLEDHQLQETTEDKTKDVTPAKEEASAEEQEKEQCGTTVEEASEKVVDEEIVSKTVGDLVDASDDPSAGTEETPKTEDKSVCDTVTPERENIQKSPEKDVTRSDQSEVKEEVDPKELEALDEAGEERLAKTREESPPDESTPSTGDKDGSKEDAMHQVFSSPEEVLKVDRPAPGRKRKRGRPKKMKSTKKGSAALKDDKDASEEEQILDSVEETVDDQLPAGHIPKNNDEQTEESASLPGSPKNEEEEEPMRQISDSLEDDQPQETTEDKTKDVTPAKEEASAGEQEKEPCGTTVEEASEKVVDEEILVDSSDDPSAGTEETPKTDNKTEDKSVCDTVTPERENIQKSPEKDVTRSDQSEVKEEVDPKELEALDEAGEERLAKTREESPPDESTPSTGDKDGSKEDAMHQVFSSLEEVLKVDRLAPGRKRKRGRPKKVKSTKKGSAALKDDKDASEEEQIVDSVDETVDDQLPAGHIPKNNDEQTEERASLPGSPKNEEEEEEPMREISDSLEDDQPQETTEDKTKDVTRAKEEASAEEQDKEPCGTTVEEASEKVVDEKIVSKTVGDLVDSSDDLSAGTEETPKTDNKTEDKSVCDTVTPVRENIQKSPEKDVTRSDQSEVKEEVNPKELEALDEAGEERLAETREGVDGKDEQRESHPPIQVDESVDFLNLKTLVTLDEAGDEEEEKLDEEQAEKTSCKDEHDDMVLEESRNFVAVDEVEEEEKKMKTRMRGRAKRRTRQFPAASKWRREPVGLEAKRSRSQSPCAVIDVKLPPFKPSNPLGQEFMVPKLASFCNLCSVFCSNENTAKDLHCSSQKHYDNLQKHYQKIQQKPSRCSTQSSQGSVSD